jgi:hypothetical protein
MPKRRRRCFIGSRQSKELPQTRHSLLLRFLKIDLPCRLTMSILTHCPAPPNAIFGRQWTFQIPLFTDCYYAIENIFDKHKGPPLRNPLFRPDRLGSMILPQVEVVLNGEYNSSELDDLLELSSNLCRNVIPLSKLPATITKEQFISRFKTWNERTSTLPSQIHLVHYKALVDRHSLSLDILEGQALKHKRKQIRLVIRKFSF